MCIPPRMRTVTGLRWNVMSRACSVVQLVDTMPPRLIYIKERGMDFLIPPADNHINYNPRSFTGSSHLLRVRLATPEEIVARRNLAFNPYDCHDSRIF